MSSNDEQTKGAALSHALVDELTQVLDRVHNFSSTFPDLLWHNESCTNLHGKLQDERTQAYLLLVLHMQGQRADIV